MESKMQEVKTETRGGAGRGQGRKSAFKEPTKGVKFMCPISKVDDLKKHVNKKLGEWAKEEKK